jgi:hypothetical protein
VVVTQRQTVGGAGREGAELFLDVLAYRFRGFEPGGIFHRVDSYALGGAVIDGADDGHAALCFRKCSHGIDTPHLVGRCGHNRRFMRVTGGCLRLPRPREQLLLAKQAED